MLKLLTCVQGHFWETAEDDGALLERCPVCGAAAESMPLLELAPTDELETPAPPPPPAPLPLRDATGRPVVAGYEVLEDLCRGPTGVAIYKARQTAINRLVLLKVVTAREDPGQLAWGSLRGEASALGRLQHPNLVHILEAGERDRQLFYNVIEFIDGPTLAQKVASKPLPIRQTLRLMETLARAVHHAHERGVVHRSLKPASILLLLQVQKSDKQMEPDEPIAPYCRLHTVVCLPKITDFGVARRPVEGDVNDRDLQGDFPSYLAPEQVWGWAKEIGPATDVHALGAILYELLTGRPPFPAPDAADILDAIQTRTPVPPSRLRSGVSADLEAICRKCLAKQPRRRYASALHLAEDLRRCAEGLPVKARKVSNAQRFARWVRRRPAFAALVLVSLVAGLTTLIVNTHARREVEAAQVQLARLEQSERMARQMTDRLSAEVEISRHRDQLAAYRQRITLAQRALLENQFATVRAMLDNCPPELRHWEWHYLKQRAEGREPLVLRGPDRPLSNLAFSSNGNVLAAAANPPVEAGRGGARGEVHVWQLRSAPLPPLRRTDLPGLVHALAFRPGDLALAIACGDERDRAGELHLWKITEHRSFHVVRFPQDRITSVAYSSDEVTLFVAEGRGIIHRLDAWNFVPQSRPFGTSRVGVNARTTRLTLSLDRKRLASVHGDSGDVNIWDSTSGRALSFRSGQRAIDVAFHPDSTQLAIAQANGDITVWDVATNQERRTLRGHNQAVTRLAYSPDGKRLASASDDGTVKIWDTLGEEEMLTLSGFAPSGGEVAFSPDGRWLAIANQKTVQVWGPPN
jgi:hypothetical protein